METGVKMYGHLVDHIRSMKSVCVAFSGGVDSTLLLHAAHEALGDSAPAVTVRGMMVPPSETAHAVEYARMSKFTLSVIDIDLGSHPEFIINDKMRCYHCKKAIFSVILDHARGKGLSHVIEGSHTADMKDYRPGIMALAELGIRSPFMETGMGRHDIVHVSRTMNIQGWDRFSSSCLATRVEYGTPLDAVLMADIHKAEETIKALGFKQVRVRAHGRIARIEVDQGSIEQVVHPAARESVIAAVKAAGFLYATIDLEGYRQGSMNSGIMEQHYE